jgi:uncharacterized protein YndB with AHSA1/START domain
MSAQREVVIAKVCRVFPYPAERVFAAWLDPQLARQFLFATPGGEMVRADVDPRVGGRFVFTDRRDGEDVEHYGEYLEIDRPHRLVFQYSITGFDAPPDIVSIEFAPHPNGCELTLTHAMGAEYAEYRDRTEKGWTMILESLANRLTSA